MQKNFLENILEKKVFKNSEHVVRSLRSGTVKNLTKSTEFYIKNSGLDHGRSDELRP
jgi:hypothetical protein